MITREQFHNLSLKRRSKMRIWRIIPILIIGVLFFGVLQAAEEQSGKKLTHAERVKAREETFFAASQAGKTVTGVIVEGNSLFNGTTAPQDRPYGSPYTDEERRAARFSAERNSKVFILTKDGTLYYPTPKKGEKISQSMNAPRIPRVLTDAQKKGPKVFTWATLVPMVGREVEVYGEIYPGYGGIKGIHIELIKFEGDYLVGE
jgi:hypothetical protein